MSFYCYTVRNKIEETFRIFERQKTCAICTAQSRLTSKARIVFSLRHYLFINLFLKIVTNIAAQPAYLPSFNVEDIKLYFFNSIIN